MTIRKNILTTLTIVLLGFGPAVVALPAYAASGNSQPNFVQGLVQMIAQKFGLDESQVQSVVTDYANQHKATMQQNMQDREKKRLDTLVSQGKITSAQEQQILDEQKKLASEYNPQTLKGLTPDERKQKLQQEKAEIDAWSQSAGIDAKYLRPGFGMRMHMFNKWNGKIGTVTPTP